MTFAGKILTMITLILSIFFAGMAVVVFATHRNWQQEAQALASRNDELVRANTTLRGTIDQYRERLQREQVARKIAIASLETSLQLANDERAQLTAENQQQQVALSEMSQTNKTTSGLLAASSTENENLRGTLQAERASRDQMFNQFVSTVDQLHGLQGEHNTLLSRNTALAAMNAQYEDALERLGPAATGAHELPPAVDGIVLAVGGPNLVEISLGKDDGLKVGHTLDVFRQGGVYLGRVVVKKTLPDRSVAEVIPDFRRGQIRSEDRVATRFVD